MTVGEPPVQLSDEQLAELGRARGKRAPTELELFAARDPPTGEEVARMRAGRPRRAEHRLEVASLRRQAETVVENGAPEQVRAAARAVLLLCDDIAARRRRPCGTRAEATADALVTVVGGAACIALVALVATRGGEGGLDATGPAKLVGKEALSTLAFSVEGDESDLATTTWRLDGEPVEENVAAADGRLVYRPRRVADGEHTVEVSRSGGLFDESRASWTFTIDTRRR